MNWRIIKRSDTPGSASGLDQQRMMYYSAGSQLCEERIDVIRPLLTMRPLGSWSVTWSTNTPIGFAAPKYVTFSGDA
ncbi:MAG: hypothetical protein V3T53_04765 [Phycisphaerales bacterium]